MVKAHDHVLVRQTEGRIRLREVLEDDEPLLIPATRNVAHGAAHPLPAAATELIQSLCIGMIALGSYLFLSRF